MFYSRKKCVILKMATTKLLIEKDWLLSATWINSPCSIIMRPKCNALQCQGEMCFCGQRKHWKEKIFLLNFMSRREWDLKGARRFCVCWFLPLICAHLTSELAFPYRRRASPWGQQSGCGSSIALHSSGIGEVQALGCNYEKAGANGGSWTACLS